MTDDRAAVSSADVAILERDVDAWTRGRVREARERYRGEGVPDVDRARRFLILYPENLDDVDAYVSRKRAQYGVRTAY